MPAPASAFWKETMKHEHSPYQRPNGLSAERSYCLKHLESLLQDSKQAACFQTVLLQFRWRKPTYWVLINDNSSGDDVFTHTLCLLVLRNESMSL